MSTAEQPLMQAKTALAVSAYISRPVHALLLHGLQGSGKGALAAYIATQIGGIRSHYNADKKDFGVEQIRELISNAKYKTASSRHVFIIEHAGLLGIESQNTLLKVVEEPPEGTFFILTTNRLQAVLPTIRSRMACIEVATPSRAQLEIYFESLGYPASAVTAAVTRAADLPGLATAFLENKTHPFNAALERVKNFIGSSPVDRLKEATQLVQDKEQASLFADALVHTSQVALEHAALADKSEVLARWRKHAVAALRLQKSLAANANAKLAFDDLCLQL